MTVSTPVRFQIRRTSATETRSAAGTLARAFADDPVSRWMIRSEERLAPGFEFYMRSIWLRHDSVFQTADGRGVACWLPPGKAHMSAAEQIRMLPGLARAARRDLPRVLAGVSAMEKHHPHEPHWYLNMLGVDPAAQGTGIGSALLANMLGRLDAEQLPAYLDATTERSRDLYERHGFEVTAEERLPKNGPPFWRMWREPRRSGEMRDFPRGGGRC